MILPNCKEVSLAFARDEYREASAAAKMRMRLHLLICRHCRRFKAQLEMIAAALKDSVFAAPDPARISALEQAILNRLV